jgi:hypothetical protein
MRAVLESLLEGLEQWDGTTPAVTADGNGEQQDIRALMDESMAAFADLGIRVEVVRVLAPADRGNPDADAWHVVTLTRPRGSTDPVWRPHRAVGPMTLDSANEFLSRLGVQAVSVAQRTNPPILGSHPGQ